MKLQLNNITKRFGSFTANDQINLTIESGEIHALLGENGAGKSTLMNVLYGLYHPEEGQILLDGKPQNFRGPGDAVAAGIGMVHQHFMLIPVFTVAESVALGFEPTKAVGGVLDLNTARSKVKELSSRFGFDIDPDALIEDLPVGSQQRVEIIKALSRDAKILILDEPTAVLTPQETDELIEIMRGLKASGTSIVFITHKLREVQAVADRITVIRHGRVVGTASPQDDTATLASAMVGRAVNLNVDKSAAQTRDVVFSAQNITVLDTNGHPQVNELSIEVRGGEILAIAGVQGNGQTELCRAILGNEPLASGSMYLGETDLSHLCVRQRLNHEFGYIPEDRSTEGMVASMSIAENMILDRYKDKAFTKGIHMQLSKVSSYAQSLQKEFDVRLNSINDPISTLSGGNAQKTILARELSRPLKFLVASQPTRGLDVGSIEFVHKRIVQERDKGTAVMVVSTELDEVVALADRIAVMYRGEIVGIVPPDTSREVLGLMMAGIRPEQITSDSSENHLYANPDKKNSEKTAAQAGK